MRKILPIILLLLSYSLIAQDITVQNENKKRIEEEIAIIDKQLTENTLKQKATIQELTLLQKKVKSRKQLLNEIDAQIRSINSRINRTQRDIKKLEQELDTLEQYYSRLVMNTYKNRDSKVWFMYVLASDNLEQGFRRYSYLKNLSKTLNLQGKDIILKKEELEAQKVNLENLKKEAQRVRNERNNEYKLIVSEENKSKKLVKQLSTNEKKYKKEIAQKRKEIDRLNREIQRILAAAVKKDKGEEVNIVLTGEFEQNRGKLPFPVESGVIIEEFGEHNHPVYKNLKMPFNNGITISTSKKATVKSVFDGVVKQILIVPGYNQCVLIQHGSYFTFYCKLSNVKVKSGDKVKLGDEIGTLEATPEGNSLLHFQIWNGTQKQDPQKWLR